MGGLGDNSPNLLFRLFGKKGWEAMRLKKEIIKLKDAIINMGDDSSSIPVDVKSSKLNDLKIVFEKHIGRILASKKDAVRKNKEYEQFLAENKMMHSDRIVAQQIQKSMLRVNYPAFPEFSQIDLFADMDSANEIGGDFYDYFKIDDDHICFSIADIEGKGIPAAMYMAVAKTLIQLRLESGESLSKVFGSVNKQLCQSSMQKRFITMWAGILELSTGKITYINAGHNAPILKRNGEKAELIKNRSGLPIASFFSKKKELGDYSEFELNIAKGDMLVLYTDGITEAMNNNSEIFGEQRLLDLIDLYATSDKNSNEISSYIRRQVLTFASNTTQDDDITLLILKFN